MPPNSDGYCPEGYLDIFPLGEKCYTLNENKVTRDTAQLECSKSEGGTLAGIHSEEEQIAVADAISRLDSTQIVNLEKISLSWYIFNFYVTFFIKKNSTVEKNWHWDDESGYNYQNWDYEQPDFPNKNSKNCAQLDFDKGKWFDEESQNTAAFLCTTNRS